MMELLLKFLSFFGQMTIVTLPFSLPAGIGGYLIMRDGWLQKLGVLLLLLFVMSFLGSLTSDTPPKWRPDNLDAFGYSMGLFMGLIGLYLGRRRLKRRQGFAD